MIFTCKLVCVHLIIHKKQYYICVALIQHEICTLTISLIYRYLCMFACVSIFIKKEEKYVSYLMHCICCYQPIALKYNWCIYCNLWNFISFWYVYLIRSDIEGIQCEHNPTPLSFRNCSVRICWHSCLCLHSFSSLKIYVRMNRVKKREDNEKGTGWRKERWTPLSTPMYG